MREKKGMKGILEAYPVKQTNAEFECTHLERGEEEGKVSFSLINDFNLKKRNGGRQSESKQKKLIEVMAGFQMSRRTREGASE
jgi:hypothetical protein